MLTALSCIGAGSFCAQKNAPLLTKADENAKQTAELISPQSYQQYLPLIAPTAVSVTQNYTAIADGNVIYLYDGNITDEQAGAYRAYTHENTVNQLAFDDDGNLYFLSELELYKLSTADFTAAAETGVVCNGFTIHDNTLYYYKSAKRIIQRSLTDNNETSFDLQTPLQDGSPLTFGPKGLFYVGKNADGYTVYTISGEKFATFSQPLKSITIANHLFGVITEDGGFYTYNYSDLNGKNADEVTPVTDTSAIEQGFIAAHSHNGEIFAVCNNSVKRYASATAAFDGFEITSASAAANRLNGANDLFLSGDKLFIADSGNNRISVYNTETGVFESAVSITLSDPYITSYKDTLFAASNEGAAIYSLSKGGYGDEVYTLSSTELDGQVIGAACVYDRYYLLTDNNYCYTFTADGETWGYAKTQNVPTSHSNAAAFTADVYGSLYVAYNDGNVYRFTEQEFLSASAGTNLDIKLNGAEKIMVDYDGALYALSNNEIHKYTQNNGGRYALKETFTPHYGLVKDDAPAIKSFAFGVEKADAYFLYAGNYAVKSQELNITTVATLAIGEQTKNIFLSENRAFSMVEVQAGSILTEFDFNALQDAEIFPYLAFERCYTPFTALKIGEENNYAIVAALNGTTAYKTYLVETSNCKTLAEESYRTIYTETDKTGYLTSSVQLYKFPYLNDLLTVESLPRGAKVTLLSELSHADRTYYEIAYTSEQGETQTGFVPKSFVNAFNGANPTVQTETYGTTEDDTDAVGRMLYILLGFGAIGILLDVLLLRKKKDADEE